MASGGTTPPFNNLVILVMNTGYSGTSATARNDEIKFFFQGLDPKPGFLLLQETTNLIETKITEGLGLDPTGALSGCTYSTFNGEKHSGGWTRIMYKGEVGVGKQVWSTTNLPDRERERYCAAHFTFDKEKILFISFHGNKNLNLLGEYLKKFQKMKEDNECQYLIIGGDFNTNMDELFGDFNTNMDEFVLDLSISRPLTLLQTRQEELIKFFTDNKLEIVPYTHQRKSKWDALICDKGLTIVEKTVYFNFCVICILNTGRNEAEYRDGTLLREVDADGTLVKKCSLSPGSFDHHPLLFTIRAPTTDISPVPEFDNLNLDEDEDEDEDEDSEQADSENENANSENEIETLEKNLGNLSINKEAE